MGIASELRESVLQAAMKGELTERLATDGTAKELLDKIGVKPIDDTSDMPFEIPDSWEWCELKSLFNIRTGLTFAKNDKYGDNVPNNAIRVLRGGNILDNLKYILDSSDVFVPNDIYKDKYIPLKTNDIITPSVTSMEKMCKSALIEKNMDNVTAGGFVYIIRTSFTNVMNPKFALYYFTSDLHKEFCRPNIRKSGQAFYNLRKTEFEIQPILVPPLSEQERIVAKVDELMKEIDELEKIENELESIKKAFPDDMKSALLQAAMKGELTERLATDGTAKELLDKIVIEKNEYATIHNLKKQPSLTSINDVPYDIPDTWKWVHLDEICKCFFTGKSPVYSKNKVTTHICIGQANNQEYGIDMKGEKYLTDDFYKTIPSYMFLEKYDVLLNTLGTGTVGRSGIWNDCKSNVATDGHLMVMRCTNSITAKYLLYNLRLKRIEIEKSADGSTNQKFLNNIAVRSYLIPLPPLAEQERIVAQLDKLLPLCENLS